MVGMARCAVPARVVAGGTSIQATLAFEGVAPLHSARTSQRDVPSTLNTYPASCRQRDRRKALLARCRQHLGGTVSFVRVIMGIAPLTTDLFGSGPVTFDSSASSKHPPALHRPLQLLEQRRHLGLGL